MTAGIGMAGLRSFGSRNDAMQRCMHNPWITVPLFVLVVIVMPILLSKSFGVVDFDEQALLFNYDGAITGGVHGSGRHFVGIGGKFLLYPRAFINIDFGDTSNTRRLQDTEPSGDARPSEAVAVATEFNMRTQPLSAGSRVLDFPSLRNRHLSGKLVATEANEKVAPKAHEKAAPQTQALTVRVLDGQMVSLALSMQIRLPKAQLKQLYITFGDYETYRTLLLRALTHRIRTVCQRFTSDDFFRNRTKIASSIEDEIRTELDSRYAQLMSLQLHSMQWPKMLNDFIMKTEGTKYRMIVQKTESTLAQQRAASDATLLHLNGEIDILQQHLKTAGEVLVKQWNSQELHERTITAMAVQRVAAKTTMDVQVFGNQTQNLLSSLYLTKTKVTAEVALDVLQMRKKYDHEMLQFEQKTRNVLLPEQAALLKVEEGQRQLLANMSAGHKMALAKHSAHTMTLQANALSAVVQTRETTKFEGSEVQQLSHMANAKRLVATSRLTHKGKAAELGGEWRVAAKKLDGEAKLQQQVLARLGTGTNNNADVEGIVVGDGKDYANEVEMQLVKDIDGKRCLGMTGTELVHLGWLEAYGALQKSGAVHALEMRTPNTLRIS